MRIALEDLHLERIAVVYPGWRRYALTEKQTNGIDIILKS